MLMKVIQPTIDEIRETYKMRVDFHRAEKRLTLQIKAICRRLVTPMFDRDAYKTEDALCDAIKKEADKLYKAITGKGEHEKADVAAGYLMPLFTARSAVEDERKRAEKALEKLAKQLPVWPWVESVAGISALTLGTIIGETGDLSNYSTVSKLWKRMGVAVINGKTQQKVKGDDAIEQGYCPRRRSIVWNMQETIVKAQIRRDKETDESRAIGPYGQVYLDRRDHERQKVETLGHANKMAKLYMGKRVLRDLWRAWRDA